MCAYLPPFGEPLPMEKHPRKDWRGPLLEKVELAGNRKQKGQGGSVSVRRVRRGLQALLEGRRWRCQKVAET